MVQFLFRYGKTERARPFAESQGASRAGTGSKSKTETTTMPACQENCHNHRLGVEWLENHHRARASASSRREDCKGAVDQAGVPGDAACGAANSSRNVGDGC
jgi:hypothetical protein